MTKQNTLRDRINELDGDEELLLDASTVFSPTKTTTLCAAEELKQLIGVCKWREQDGEPAVAGCNNVDFIFTEDGIAENGFNFCPFCGGKIEVKND